MLIKLGKNKSRRIYKRLMARRPNSEILIITKRLKKKVKKKIQLLAHQLELETGELQELILNQ